MADSPLSAILQSWKDDTDHGRCDDREAHISTAAFYRLSGSGGIEHADPALVEHLSLCPRCLENWAAWRRAISDVESLESDTPASGQRIPAVGFLKAAAAPGRREPLHMTSRCGRYRLSLLPNIDHPGSALLTLEVLEKAAQLEGLRLTVRDRGGSVLVSGVIHQGRMAKPVDNVDAVDLSIWTVTDSP